MIKILRSASIIDIQCNISFKRLISETISTWSKKTPHYIDYELDEEEVEKRSSDIIAAIKDGYSSILEMPNIHASLILPRLATLALVSYSIGSNFLQQSLRYTMPLIKEKEEKNIFIFIPNTLKNKENKIISYVERAYSFYNELMSEIQVLETRKPEEDARYHLPLCIGTFISCSINLSHIVHMLSTIRYYKEHSLKIPSIWTDLINNLSDSLSIEYRNLVNVVSSQIKIGKFYPNPFPFASSNFAKKIENVFSKNGKNEVNLISYNVEPIKKFTKDEIKNIIVEGVKEGNFRDFNDLFFLFGVKDSLVSRHQIIRHRTIQQQSISLYEAAERMEMIVPNSIRTLNSDKQKKYVEFLNDSINLYEELKNEDENDAIIVLPSNLAMISTLRLDGYNIFNFRGFIGNRCCELAQAETQIIASMINNKINEVFIKEDLKELTYITHANCFKLRRCPELEQRARYCTIFKQKSYEKPLFI